jgi:hypothetical protein
MATAPGTNRRAGPECRKVAPFDRNRPIRQPGKLNMSPRFKPLSQHDMTLDQ